MATNVNKIFSIPRYRVYGFCVLFLDVYPVLNGLGDGFYHPVTNFLTFGPATYYRRALAEFYPGISFIILPY